MHNKLFSLLLILLISNSCSKYNGIPSKSNNAPVSEETRFFETETSLTDQFLKASEQEGSVLFTSPEGWGAVNPQSLGLSEVIKAMVIGKGQHEFPPSLNLMVHPYSGSVKDYLKEIKMENDAIKAEFKDLGNIQIQAGEARLCQVDLKTKYGDVREMHVILKKDDSMFVLTAGALKEEFPRFYNDFFSAFRSLRFK